MAQGSVDPALRNWLYATQVKSNKLEYQVFLRFAFTACFLFISSSSIRMSSSSSLIPKRKLKQRQDKDALRYTQVSSRCAKGSFSLSVPQQFMIFFSSSQLCVSFPPTLVALPPDPRAQPVADYQQKAPGRTHERHTLWSRIVEINRPWLHTNFMKMEMNVALFIYLLASSFCCSFQLLSINFNAYSLSSLYLTGILVHYSYKTVCVHVAISEMPTFQ